MYTEWIHVLQADIMWKENNPRTTLDKFCMWAAVNSLREHEVGHYDFAMYLSRGRMKPAGKGRVFIGVPTI